MHGSGCGGYTARPPRGDQVAIEKGGRVSDTEMMIVRTATTPVGCDMRIP